MGWSRPCSCELKLAFSYFISNLIKINLNFIGFKLFLFYSVSIPPLMFTIDVILQLKNGYNAKHHTDSDTSDFLCANVEDFPWHASVVIKYLKNKLTPYPLYHSGVILNEKWIIVAAHVIAGAVSIRVDVGSVNLSNPLVSVYPDAYIMAKNISEITLHFFDSLAKTFLILQ